MPPEQDPLLSFVFIVLVLVHSHRPFPQTSGLFPITQTWVRAYDPHRIVCSERRVHLLTEWWGFTHPCRFGSDNTQHRQCCLPLRHAEGSGLLSSLFPEQPGKGVCLPRGQGLRLTNLYNASPSKATWNRTGVPKKLLLQPQNKQTSGCSNDRLTAPNTSQ